MVVEPIRTASDVSEASRAQASPAHVVGGIDVRAYKRLNALVLAGPAGLRLFQRTTPGVRADVAKLRMYCDEALKLGERLRLEVFARDGEHESFKVLVEVAWVINYPDPSRANFEVGFDVKGLAPSDAAKLARVTT